MAGRGLEQEMCEWWPRELGFPSPGEEVPRVSPTLSRWCSDSSVCTSGVRAGKGKEAKLTGRSKESSRSSA